MTSEAKDFLEECDVLRAALGDADQTTLHQVTQFKNWTIEDVIGHLHMWNHAAMTTLENREAFHGFLSFALGRMSKGDTHPEMQRAWLQETQGGVSGVALFRDWADFYPLLAERYAAADPDRRVAWAGPDMTVRAKIVARQMETWAHGQEVFDCLGEDRPESDRIKNICHLGVTTYSWTFRNRGETPPRPKPFIKLISPSGATWEWNEAQDDNYVKGSAVEFARVVTQTRNIADTSLVVAGTPARSWMEIAQCFAGAPETPPAKGTRHKQFKR